MHTDLTACVRSVIEHLEHLEHLSLDSQRDRDVAVATLVAEISGFVASRVATEREACARLFEVMRDTQWAPDTARLIRARRGGK
jgi:hypothetical protein